VDGAIDSLAEVLDIHPVTRVSSIAMNDQWFIHERAGDEARDDFLEMLVRTVGIEGSEDEGMEAIGDLI
jgi:hypothetical protein